MVLRGSQQPLKVVYMVVKVVVVVVVMMMMMLVVKAPRQCEMVNSRRKNIHSGERKRMKDKLFEVDFVLNHL